MNFVEQFTNTIQYLCLPQGNWFPDELFFRGNGKTIYSECNSAVGRMLLIPEKKTVSLDTYFNMFPVFKWLRYTKMADLSVDVVLKGDARVTLVGLNRKNPDEEITLKEAEFHAAEKTSFRMLECEDLIGESALPDFLFLKISSVGEQVILYDVLFSTSAQCDPDLNIACCFCTFKREADIKRNVENLLSGIVHNEESSIRNRLHIYVSDNGQTLPLDLYENEPTVHLFYNKNYGGSAGFTRCMIESCFRNEGKPFSHIILMDDDALILPEVVERTAAMIGILKEQYGEYMLGGALLSKEEPWIQRENGALLNIDTLRRVLCGRMTDLTCKESLVPNEESDETDINYNGWWYTCLPTHIISEYNLSLPLFLHYDDQEYGVRNGGKFIRMNGICVWHPNLSGVTKIKAYIGYYDSRNALIIQASSQRWKDRKSVFSNMAKMLMEMIVNYRYLQAQYSVDGYAMFYRGINALCEVDAEKLNRQIMNGGSFEKCAMTPGEMQAMKKGTLQIVAPGAWKRKLKKFLNWLIPAYKGSVLYNETVTWDEIDFFAVRQIYIADSQTGQGIVLKKSYREAAKAFWHFVKFAACAWKKHDQIYHEWYERCGELKTYEFWQKYLDIGTQNGMNIDAVRTVKDDSTVNGGGV